MSSQEWEKWRKATTEELKKIKDSLSSSQKTEPKPSPSLPFEKFLSEHADGCPECQKVLEKHGFVKKEEKKEPPAKSKEEKKEKGWSVSDV